MRCFSSSAVGIREGRVATAIFGEVMITITDKGAEKVQEFLASQGADTSSAGLRVGVRGGGCSGFQYNLAFDEQRDGDEVFTDHGLKILVDAPVAAVRARLGHRLRRLAAGRRVPGQQPERRRGLRLRLVVPRRRRGRGLRGLRPRAPRRRGARSLAVVIAVVVVLVSRGDDEQPAPPAPTAPTRTQPPAPRAGHARARHRADRGQSRASSRPATSRPRSRPRATAPPRCKPAYYRLMVDWRRLQPPADAPPDWDPPVRRLPARHRRRARSPPASATILRAIRARQQADGGWQVVVDASTARPDWALRGGVAGLRHGPPARTSTRTARSCARSATSPPRRASRSAGGRRGTSPTTPSSSARSAGVPRRDADAADARREYANIVLALQAELGPRRPPRARRGRRLRPARAPGAVGAAEFAAALPARASSARATSGPSTPTCARTDDGRAAAATTDDTSLAGDRTRRATRRSCATSSPRWTPTAASAATGSGSPRPASAARARARTARPTTRPTARSCEAMDGALRCWADDPRVDAAFQYTFREDTSFPVGLADARPRSPVPQLRRLAGVERARRATRARSGAPRPPALD